MNRVLGLILLALLLGGACVAALGWGAMAIGWQDIARVMWQGASAAEIDTRTQTVIFDIRLPRLILGALVGATLGVTGAVMQVLFRNPLADAGLTGVSSGAALGAAIMILIAARLPQWGTVLGVYGLPLAAFLGGLVTAGAVFLIARDEGKTPLSHLLLAGIAINALCGSMMGFLVYAADESELRTLTFWTLGSLGGASWQTVAASAPLMLIGLLALPLLGKSLNAMTLGDQEAFSLGVPVEAVKIIAIILTTLGVGAAVAVAGMIGFVGIVIPHVLRLTFGADHRLLLIAAALAGATLLVGADVFSRVLVAPAELPIGILTASIGAPFFLGLLMRLRSRGGVS